MKGARAHGHVIRLRDHAPAFGPELLQAKDQLLKIAGSRRYFLVHQ
jgi:hypothetical protein